MIVLRSMAIAGADLAHANALAGVHEQGGNNMGAQVQFWEKTVAIPAGSSWCDAFVYAMYLKAWCIAHGLLMGGSDEANQAIMLAHADQMSQETGVLRSGSCQDSAAHAKHLGRFHGPDYHPVKGDQVFYDLKKLGVTHHTGIYYGNGLVVEGNTSASHSGSQDNGDGVYAKPLRPVSVIYGSMHLE